jgi:hypothetical protein
MPAAFNRLLKNPEHRERAIPIRWIRMALFTCPKCRAVAGQVSFVLEEVIY